MLCKRALKRNISPEKRAMEVKIEDISDEKWSRANGTKNCPARRGPTRGYAFGCSEQ